MDAWESVDEVLIEEAERDLRDHDQAVPCLVAFAGDVLLFLALLRRFDESGYRDPLIELFALAGPLGADRMKFAITGRAWSLDDPIPPVDEQLGDLRQRVLMIETADGACGGVRCYSLVLPFDREPGTVRWGAPQRMTGGEGWIPYAMATTIRQRGRFDGSSIEHVRQQAVRCAALGHALALGDAVAEQIMGNPVPDGAPL